MSDRYKVLFIAFVSLGIYYPSLFGEINSVDDYQMITALMNTDRIPWKELFLPSSSPVYYRPLLMLTFYFDRFAFGCSEFFMHFDNVAIHAINSILIFFIVRKLLDTSNITSSSFAPMFAALLFALHPINAEPVNFISGRTDVLAATFVLLSFLVFLNRGIDDLFWCWIAAFFYLLGLFAKEVALALLLAIGLFLALKETPQSTMALGRRMALISPFIFVTVIYLFMRKMLAFQIGATNAASESAGVHTSLLTGISTSMKVIGFYTKKLFLPLPLNFGIININGIFYFWLGAIILCTVIYLLFRKRTLSSFLFLCAVLFFLPALPVAVSRMAWTPLAERYLYISSFGISALTLLWFERVNLRRGVKFGILSILLIACGTITTNRNIIWQSNLTLYEDTVRKSPDFAGARNEYGLAMMKKGRLTGALEQFTIAEKLAGNAKYSERPSINVMVASASGKKLEEIKNYFLELLEKDMSPESAKIVLGNVIKTTERQINDKKNPSEKKAYYRELIAYNESLFRLDNNGFYLYRIGQLYISLGEEKKAVEYFKKSVQLSPHEYFSESARKLIRRLGHANNLGLHPSS